MSQTQLLKFLWRWQWHNVGSEWHKTALYSFTGVFCTAKQC